MRKLLTVCAGLAIFIVMSAAGQVPQPQQATLAVGSATLGEVKGDVLVRPPQGAAVAAQRGQVVIPESVIEIGKGSAVLTLQDGSQVLVKGHSRVVVKSPSSETGTFLELLIGKLVAQVQKRLGNAPSFKMGTPSAVITVRGTRFSVEVMKDNKTFVDVFEGLVDVAGIAAQNQPVQLRPGFWTEVERDHVPTQPREENDRGTRGEPGREQDRFSPGMRREPGESGLSNSGEAGEGSSAGQRTQQQEGGGATQPTQQKEPD